MPALSGITTEEIYYCLAAICWRYHNNRSFVRTLFMRVCFTWEADTRIIWASLCHCEDCKRAASSDYVNWFGVEKDTVIWQGPQKCYSSSELVIRRFCEECGSPMSFKIELFPSETHLYAVTLDNVSVYHPTSHIFWLEHLPWVKFSGNLPWHAKSFQQKALDGK